MFVPSGAEFIVQRSTFRVQRLAFNVLRNLRNLRIDQAGRSVLLQRTDPQITQITQNDKKILNSDQCGRHKYEILALID